MSARPFSEVIELERGLLRRGGRFLCWHRYKLDVVVGLWRYQECSRCSRRVVSRMYWNLFGPLDWGWLETGEWTRPPTVPPPRPSGLRGVER